MLVLMLMVLACEKSSEEDSVSTTEDTGTGSPGDCSGWEMLETFYPEVSLEDLGACTTVEGQLVADSLMNFENTWISGTTVVAADGSDTAQPCVEVLCDSSNAYIASNALPHYDPQAQPIFDTVDTPIVHKLPLSMVEISSSVAADSWDDIQGCDDALSMYVDNTTPDFPPSSHCYYETEEGEALTGEWYISDGEETVHKVHCYGQTGSVITGIPTFAPCEEARPDPYGSPLFSTWENQEELFVDLCGTHPAAITHNHWLNEVCLEQDDNNEPATDYVTGASAFDIESLDEANCSEVSDILGWSYDGFPMMGSCVCMARSESGECTDLRRARSGYVYAGLGRWADDTHSDTNVHTETVEASALGFELDACETQADCCEPGDRDCRLYCHPLLVDGDAGVEMENRCVTPDYSWCSHDFSEHEDISEDDGYVYLDRCNGVETADGYRYVGTVTFPYVNSCYKGEPSEMAKDDTYIRLDVGGGPPN